MRLVYPNLLRCSNQRLNSTSTNVSPRLAVAGTQQIINLGSALMMSSSGGGNTQDKSSVHLISLQLLLLTLQRTAAVVCVSIITSPDPAVQASTTHLALKMEFIIIRSIYGFVSLIAARRQLNYCDAVCWWCGIDSINFSRQYLKWCFVRHSRSAVSRGFCQFRRCFLLTQKCLSLPMPESHLFIIGDYGDCRF